MSLISIFPLDRPPHVMDVNAGALGVSIAQWAAEKRTSPPTDKRNKSNRPAHTIPSMAMHNMQNVLQMEMACGTKTKTNASPAPVLDSFFIFLFSLPLRRQILIASTNRPLARKYIFYRVDLRDHQSEVDLSTSATSVLTNCGFIFLPRCLHWFSCFVSTFVRLVYSGFPCRRHRRRRHFPNFDSLTSRALFCRALLLAFPFLRPNQCTKCIFLQNHFGSACSVHHPERTLYRPPIDTSLDAQRRAQRENIYKYMNVSHENGWFRSYEENRSHFPILLSWLI